MTMIPGETVEKNKSIKNSIFIFILVLVTIPIRLWKLEEFPRFFGWEHSWFATDAVAVLRGEHHTLIYNFFNFPSGEYLNNLVPHLYFADFAALSILFFGYNLAALKLVGAVFGACAVLFSYLFLKRWADTTSAFLGALLFATAPAMIGLSRDLHVCVTFLVPFAILVAHALMLTLERPTSGRFLLAYCVMFFSLHQYHAAYVLPLLLGIVWFAYFIFNGQWRRAAIRSSLWTLPLAMLILVPVLYYQLDHSTQRPGTLLKHLTGNYLGVPGGETLSSGIQINAYLIWHHIVSDGSPLYFYHGVGDYLTSSGTVVFPWHTVLFFIGLLRLLFISPKSKLAQVVLVLAVVGLLPPLFSMGLSRRLVIFDSAFYLICAMGLSWLLGLVLAKLPNAQKNAFELVVALGIALGSAYFGTRTFVDLAEAAPRYPEREYSERAAEMLREGATVLNTFPAPGIIGAVEFFSASVLSRVQFESHFVKLARRSDLDTSPAPVPPDSKYIAVALREGNVTKSACTLEAAKQNYDQTLASKPGMAWENVGVAPDQYALVKFPIDQLEAALAFARGCTVE